MASRSVAAVGVAAALALAVGAAAVPTEPRVDPRALARTIDAQLEGAFAAAEARTRELTARPRLAWAIATDEQTVLDLTADELAFKPQACEAIELGQVRRADHRVVLLLHLGHEDATRLPLGEPGRHVIAGGGQLRVVEVATVEPRTRGDELRGVVALSRPVDLGPLGAELGALGAAARLAIGDGVVTVGAAADAPATEARLSSEPELRLTLFVPRARRGYLYAWALALAALSLGLALASRERARFVQASRAART